MIKLKESLQDAPDNNCDDWLVLFQGKFGLSFWDISMSAYGEECAERCRKGDYTLGGMRTGLPPSNLEEVNSILFSDKMKTMFADVIKSQ